MSYVLSFAYNGFGGCEGDSTLFVVRNDGAVSELWKILERNH